MKGALVDREGFPRADIDIYAVRTARQKVLCLQNDHKALMKLLEKKLHQLHAEERERRGSTDELPSNRTVPINSGFVRVNEVSPGSPAATAVSVCVIWCVWTVLCTTSISTLCVCVDCALYNIYFHCVCV